MRLLLTALLCFCSSAFAATATPPESWFLLDHVLSLKRAEEVVEITRESFWTNTKLPDGRPIVPKDEAERATAPVERMDALYFAQAAQLAGLAEWCGLDPLPYVKHALSPAWGKFRDMKQIIFVSMLFGAVARDVRERMNARGACNAANRDATEKGIKVAMEKPKPAAQETQPPQPAQRP